MIAPLGPVSIVPDYLLREIETSPTSTPEQKARAKATRLENERLRQQREPKGAP